MIPLQGGVQTRAGVFEEIFLVFLGLGTLVGLVVVAYVLYNVYAYRYGGREAVEEDPPTVGELPTGGGSGKKLFVSFGLSAIIVISLVVWTYGMLMYVESGPEGEPADDSIEIDVVGIQFSWSFTYGDSGAESTSEMVVPEDTTVWLDVTSADVWHSFGAPELRVKADAIPGEVDRTWFHTNELEDGEPEEYRIECFELCGEGHSVMVGTIRVVPQDEYQTWLEEQGGDGGEGDDGDNETAENETAGDENDGNATAGDENGGNASGALAAAPAAAGFDGGER